MFMSSITARRKKTAVELGIEAEDTIEIKKRAEKGAIML